MTRLKFKNYFHNQIALLTLLALLTISCMPEKFEVKEDFNSTESDIQSTDETPTGNGNTSEQRKLTQVANFLQLGTLETTSTLSIFADFQDSFLLRGNNIIETLTISTKTNQSNFCIVVNFPGSTGTNAKNILVLSARVRSYYSTALNTKEFFFQIEPNNKTNNEIDCLTVSMNNSIQTIYSTTNIAYSLEEVCPSCSVNLSSTSLRIFNSTGVEQGDLSIANLFINSIPPIGSSVEQPTFCSENSTCSSIGFNCCLSGQCVNHGQVRPEVNNSSDKYIQALKIIGTRPELIKDYTDVFYVCSEMVPTDTPNNGSGEPDDPLQNANDLFEELTNYYNCLTPTIDEISICKRDFSNASNLMAAAPYGFAARLDDLTFANLNPLLLGNNITKIEFGGKVYFQEQLYPTDTAIPLDINYGSIGAKNDNLSTAQIASLQIPTASDATDDILSIYYKIDGTCEKLGSSLARCKKVYKQGQVSTPPRSSDHITGNQLFSLPTYVDTGFNVIVEVGGSPVPTGTDTWQLAGNNIVFDSVNFPVFDNQEIEITYFVSADITALTESRELAQSAVDSHCACDPLEDACSLKPIYTEVNGSSQVTSYVCIYPKPNTPDAPLQETVYISAKSVPQKFYDTNGVNYDLGTIGSEFGQEGNLFEYTDGHNLKPNNLSQYVGFNEIYGSMNNGSAAPVPPTVVEVEKGKVYDIFVDEGSFSTCLNCGTDYFSSMQKVFPNNFKYKGAGYSPDMVESRRVTNQGDHAADDTRFGRACFVPATMIPWTHISNSDVTTQRKNRMDAQHFLFANGYNKDWYGFDYGSIIGSFDGVTWFAVGGQRKIKAGSKKLYLSVNAYFGDLTINNTFKVIVNEEVPILNSGSLVLNDIDSDGAECQRAHLCQADNDCITQLGYDYACVNVSSYLTPWPQFDTNGNEISGSTNRSLASLIGGTQGEAKRCVYRGQGAMCAQNSLSVTSANSYASSTEAKVHTCSPNSTCAAITASNFNTKIARFAESPKSQNIQSFITDKTDSFGLAARNLGRPYNFYGSEQIPPATRIHLANLNIDGLCVPGKAPELATSNQDANFLLSTTMQADKMLNIGRTIASTVLQDENYYALCPSTNDDGDFTNTLAVSLNDVTHKPYAIRNNISTNALLLPSLTNLNFFNDDENPVTNIGYHKNTCLRAPGASCYSDFECAPNTFVSGKIKTLSSMNGEVSAAEQAFWEEELTCGGPRDRYLPNSIVPNPEYDLTQNRCCRETGNDFTYYTQKHEGSSFKVVNNVGTPLIPGVNQDLNDPERYTRTHTVYDKLISDPTNYPSLVSAASQPTIAHILNGDNIKQYKTLHLNNSRMCCTGHWVRNFASGTNGNGGGHTFTATKMQNIAISTFKTLNWNANNVPAVNNFPSNIPYDPELQTFTCTPEDHLTSDCEIKNITQGSTEEKKYLAWFGKFELLGIPQVLIETNNTIFKPLATEPMDIDGDLNDDFKAQDDISALKLPLENTIKDINTTGVADVNYSSEEFYSASSYDNFEIGSSKLKKVFSEESFNCCIPTGVAVPETTVDSQCCTGNVTNVGGPARCCLNDFTDVSVYTNRYVSSEGAFDGANETSDSDIDPKSGYVKKELVLEMSKNVCCSGQATYGYVIDEYYIPIDYDKTFNDARTRRWMYNETLDNDPSPTTGISRVDLFNAGVRWNDHVYCIPQELADRIVSGSSDSSGGGSGSGGSGSVQETN